MIYSPTWLYSTLEILPSEPLNWLPLHFVSCLPLGQQEEEQSDTVDFSVMGSASLPADLLL